MLDIDATALARHSVRCATGLLCVWTESEKRPREQQMEVVDSVTARVTIMNRKAFTAIAHNDDEDDDDDDDDYTTTRRRLLNNDDFFSTTTTQ